MANYRVLRICNNRKIKVRYDKDKNHIIIETPDGGIVDGTPNEVLSNILKLTNIIQSMIPEDCSDSGCNIEDRIVESEVENIIPVNGSTVKSIVHELANMKVQSGFNRTLSPGRTAIKVRVPSYCPEDAADLIEEHVDSATTSFQKDITDWAIESEKQLIGNYGK